MLTELKLIESRMATAFVAGMRGETARELERIRGEVALAKEELRVRFEGYFQMLRDKHLELVAQLDEVVHVAETQVAERQEKLNQLQVAKADVSHALQHNELNETLMNVSRELDEKIRGLEANVDRIPSVWLEWHDGWLGGGMAGLCRLCEGVSYVNRHNPVWSGVDIGKGQIKLCTPSGLSIDRENGDIFVCVCLANRIQVFSKEGNYSRTIKTQGMPSPDSITVSLHHLFVSCGHLQTIYKLDKVSGDILCRVETGCIMYGLSIDTDTLYAGMYGANSISHLSVEDLGSVGITPLNSPHITEDTKLWDIRLAPSLFIVLFRKCPYSVQSFSRDGTLMRSIVSQEQLIRAYHFCLDRHMNIIISDTDAHNIKVFNREGQLVTTIGQEGTEPGQFQSPQGIAINREGLIVVVDLKNSHKLQFF